MLSAPLCALLARLADGDVRRLAWAIASPSLFDARHPDWQGRLRDDAWSLAELERCSDWLLRLDADPAARRQLHEALGDPTLNSPLGHTFEKLVLFWQSVRPDVRASTRGLMVREAGRTLGEFDVVLLRHDGVIETLEVTVKFYLNLRPKLGIDGCIGPRAFDRMTDKYRKMTTRQTDLGHTTAGRAAICRWLEAAQGEARDADALVIENHALARGYVFHAAPDVAVPQELSPGHGRGLWQTDELDLPPAADGGWRLLSGREWLGPYSGDVTESGWPNDPAMPRLFARLLAEGGEGGRAAEVERRFVVRANSGLFGAVKPLADQAGAP
jgi:hypothetical protein